MKSNWMSFTYRRFCLFIVAVLAILAVAGCQPAQKAVVPTITALPAQSNNTTNLPAVSNQADSGGPTVYPEPQNPADGAQPVDQSGTSGEAYPGVTEQPVVAPTAEAASSGDAYPYPADGGAPAAVQAVENRSKVTAKLIEASADPQTAGNTRLHAQVLTSEAVEGLPNFTSKLVNTESDLLIETAKLPDLKPGDSFEAVVTFRGDEKGGKYFVIEIKKLG